MQQLTAGANAPVEGTRCTVSASHPPVPGYEIDVSAFLLGADGKVRSDDDMVFYGQPASPDGNVRFSATGPSASRFEIDLDRIPAQVERIAVCATIHEGAAKGQNFGALSGFDLVVAGSGEPLSFSMPTSGATQVAMTVGELYRRNGAWKFRAVGQGFDGGLAPLARGYGVTVEDTPAPAPAPSAPAAPPKVDLVKQKIVDLAKRDPKLAESAERARVSLEKRGQSGLRAKVALVLDISMSMDSLYRSGAMDDLVRKALGVGFQADDDGDIDVFLFGAKPHVFGPVNEHNYKTFTKDMRRKYPLEANTLYGESIHQVRDFYRGRTEGLPVYVLFVTDGDANDKSYSERSIIDASREPLFWQFVAIDRNTRGLSKTVPRGFDFLAKLDAMPGRFIDNAGFFSVRDPSGIPDDDLYESMFSEFPDWLRLARDKGLVTAA
jgi:Uncharacterized proteins involved in stress response, homologs of TerZ and putative cAMP-binding protein CABP1